MNQTAADIDEYLAVVPEPGRTALQHLREVIGRVAPAATETISYGMPAFKHEGTLVSFAAFKAHCSLFPMSVEVMATFTDKLAAYDASKGTIRFDPERPLPDDLVEDIVRARVAENEARAAERRAKKRRRASEAAE